MAFALPRPDLRRLARAVAKLLGAAMAFSVLQVLAVRFVDPPITMTMIGQIQAVRAEGGGLHWIAYRRRSLDELGPAVARAAVSAEDARFFLHRGFDWEAVCSAVDAYAPDAKRLRGGSTITQQVAKNVFLWQERSWLRKGLEVWYTILLEALVPKERILELYLNVAETGKLTFGFEAGAQRYWQKPAAELTSAQAAQLAAILPSPRKWSPGKGVAASRADWIVRHPAPFPGDRGFDAQVEWYAEHAKGPLDCF